jgi:hypothetical protein
MWWSSSFATGAGGEVDGKLVEPTPKAMAVRHAAVLMMLAVDILIGCNDLCVHLWLLKMKKQVHPKKSRNSNFETPHKYAKIHSTPRKVSKTWQAP